MCLDERNTDNRARPRPASLILRRTVAVRRAVRSLNLDMARPLLLLPFLAEDVLVCVSHALALVWLGRTVAADLGGDVTNFLLVDATHDDFRRLRRGNRDTFRDRKIYVVGKAKLQLKRLALHRRTKAHTCDLKFLFKPFGDARHHVGDQRARRAPHRAGPLALVTRLELDRALVHDDRYVVVDHDLKRTFRTLHFYGLAFNVGGDASRDRNRFIADA